MLAAVHECNLMDQRSNGLARLVIAAPQGRSGKTTLSLGLCAALAGGGLAVQPFKKGPDFIDPSWLSEAAGKPCRSLDPFFCALDEPGGEERLRLAFAKGIRNADLGLVEGNHGLYDSSLTVEGEELGAGSTAAVARALGAPILLVVNTARMSRSAAAMVHGYQTFEPATPIAGVVLNNVAHARHESKLRQSIERHCGIPVVGALPRDADLTIPDRHLGLVPRAEGEQLIPAIAACRRVVEQHVNLDQVLKIARSDFGASVPKIVSTNIPAQQTGAIVRVGIVRDEAFSFYYPENLEALVEAGAELVFFSALHDEHLPAVDGLYIGGGFPEMFMDRLEANAGLRGEIRAQVEGGLPVYAECGGLMYLSQRIHWGDRSYAMSGVLPCEVEMTARPQGHGYVQAETTDQALFFPAGARLRGHEFHHSRLIQRDAALPTAYRLQRGAGLGAQVDGLVYRNVLAAYTHLHAASASGWAEGFVARMKAG